MASRESQREMRRNSARSFRIRRRTYTPRFPSVFLYSGRPVLLRYSKYSSAHDACVRPRHSRAIIPDPRSREVRVDQEPSLQGTKARGLHNPYIATALGELVADNSGSADAAESPGAAPPRAALNRPSMTRFLMIFLFLLAVWAIIDPQLGQAFALIANVVLMPLIGFGGTLPVLTILLAGMLTTTVSSVIRDHYTNWVKMARTQKIMSAWRKEQMEALRKGQTTKLEKLKEAQQPYMKDQMEVQMTPMKSMAWTMFMFIVVFTWLRLFVDVVLLGLGNQWIAVPWSTHVHLNSVHVFPSWILLYSLLAIPFGQIVTRVLKYVHFRRRLEEMGVPPRSEAGEST